MESLDYYSYGSYGGGGGSSGAHNNINEQIAGLRVQIKKIARSHIGQNGRKGAIFERGSMGEGIVPDEPLLRNLTSSSEQANADGSANNAAQGKWRIPLGAYHTLMSYLTSDGQNVVEGIPSEQLRAATLGRERMDKKSYATVTELLSRKVSPVVCSALAPYQRAGVEFILNNDGRALLADEMGLGKTVQAIAAMSAYMESDWPLLVLCPSTARYHWEAEIRQWIGSKSKKAMEDAKAAPRKSVACPPFFRVENLPPKEDKNVLKNKQINVLTSGKDVILKYDGSTRVVICSIGLIVNLVTSNRIHPGMFKAIVFDESHALKSKSTKRTKTVLPLLKAAERCLLLSGTPAFARPSELWPQLSVLGSRGRGTDVGRGIWCDEAEFMTKYVKGKNEEGGNKAKLAELHTMLTSTVMIRRMKSDILKNLPSKIREKIYIKIEDENLRNEFRLYMGKLREGRGVLGKLARAHHHEQPAEPSSTVLEQTDDRDREDGVKMNKEVLHHLYSITGRSKINRVTKMLKSWLADPTKGKLCIFAHHLDVLNEVGSGAGLSNSKGSATKFIRIDGSTSPKARQEQILQFQTDPTIRIAMLGITAAGVAVTLTAASTVWFTELFWTPAIMIQAEDRCHRIGQQARVRCLYFIGKGTLDEVLWKLIEKKFRDLGEFVEGKEGMGIALEREIEDGEDEDILKSEDTGDDGSSTKTRKAQDVFSELLDPDDAELKKEIDELCHEEIDMLNIKNDDDEEEPDIDEKGAVSNEKVALGNITPAKAASTEMVIELLDDEDTDVKPTTIAHIRELYRESRILAKLKIEPHVQFNNIRAYTLEYPGPNYGLIMVSCNGRVVVKSHQTSSTSNNTQNPKIGSIIVGVNGYLIPYSSPFQKVLMLMKTMMRNPPVTVMFAEDDDFTSMFIEDFIPNLPVRRVQQPTMTASSSSTLAGVTSSSNIARPAPVPPTRKRKNSEVIELLDDD